MMQLQQLLTKIIVRAWGGIFYLMLVSVAIAQENALPYVFSNRVGKIIDRNEREYFCLFPYIDNFVSAKSFALADSVVELVFTRHTDKGNQDTTFIITRKQAENIGYFITNFETILRDISEKNAPLNLRDDFVNVPHVFALANLNTHGAKTIVTIHGGEQDTGTLLCVTDTSLVLWQSTKPYNWRLLHRSIKAVKSSEIEEIVFVHEGHFWSGVGYGALIGGGAGALIGFASGDDPPDQWFSFTAGEKAEALGIFLGASSAIVGGIVGAIQNIDDDFTIGGNAETYKAIVPALKRRAFFPTLPPPELQAFPLQSTEGIIKPSLEQTKYLRAIPSIPSPKKFHFYFSGALVGTGASSDISSAFNASGFGGTVNGWFGSIHYPVDEGDAPFVWNYGAEYNLTDKFRLGLAWNKTSEQKIVGCTLVAWNKFGRIDENDEVEQARATFLYFFMDYVTTPVDPMLTSRWEFAIGAGLGYSEMSVDGDLDSHYGSEQQGSPSYYAVSKNAVGINLRGSLDYYLSTNFSLQAKLEGRIIPAIDVPSVTYKPITLNAHSVDFSGIDFSLGIGLHI
ncbi:MAG: hypothetical protein KGJ59_13810 [Bacteroidota bacterium]|nr:hypothetical protein [Bacteroidota bacterium]